MFEDITLDIPKIEADTAKVIIRPVRVLWGISEEKKRIINFVLQLYSRLWGGIYSAIVPLKGGKIAPYWLDFSAKFDPDIIVSDEQLKKEDYSSLSPFLFLTTSEISEYQKERDSSTFGLGMNLHKVGDIVSLYPFEYTIPRLPRDFEIYKHAAIGFPPSEYRDSNYYSMDEWEDFNFSNHIYEVPIYKKLENKLISIANYSTKKDLDLNLKTIQRPIYSIWGINRWSLTHAYTKFPKELRLLLFAQTPVIVGNYDNIQSLALYWNLRCLFNNILWIPETNLDSVLKLMDSQGDYFALISTELDENELKAITDQMQPLLEESKITHVSIDDLSIFPSTLPFATKYGEKTIPVTFIDEEAVFTADNVESFLEDLNLKVGRINFIVDIQLSKYNFPNHPLLKGSYSSDPNARVTQRKTLSFYLTDDIDPTINSPTTEYLCNLKKPKIFSSLVKFFENGYKSNFVALEYSDKGNYTRETVRLLGSLESVQELTQDIYYNAIIQAFMIRREGMLRKRFLSYKALENNLTEKLGSSPNEGALHKSIDYLIQKGVIHQGLMLKCPKCSNKDWYNLRLVSDTFFCSRCGTVNYVLFKPNWSYQLNEVVFQTWIHSSLSVIKSLLKLKKTSTISFDYFPEFVFQFYQGENSEEREFDFFVIIDGNVGIGEVKTRLSDFKQPDFEKLNMVIEKTEPDMIILAFDNLKDRTPFINSFVKDLHLQCEPVGVKLLVISQNEVQTFI